MLNSERRRVFADKFMQGFMASSPYWRKVEQDARLTLTFADNVDGFNLRPKLTKRHQFQMSVLFDCCTIEGIDSLSETSRWSDFELLDGNVYVLEVDESANYSVYLQCWEDNHVATKTFFRCLFPDETRKTALAPEYIGKAVGVSLADIINAEPEIEVES